jgi:hypothetical protein
MKAAGALLAGVKPSFDVVSVGIVQVTAQP